MESPEYEPVGWLSDDLHIESNTEYEDVYSDYFSGPAMAFKTKQSYTVQLKDIDTHWECTGIFVEQQMHYDSQKYGVFFKNLWTGEQKSIYCSVSAALLMTIPEGDVTSAILSSVETMMTPHEVQSFRLYVEDNHKHWVHMGVAPKFATGGYISNPAEEIAKSALVGYDSPDELSRLLPGVDEMVMNPVTKERTVLRSVIINLNDRQKWSREQIADWLEEISDSTGENGPDLRFKVDSEEKV